MQLLELTLDTAAENVALDEALLDAAESGSAPGQEVLRLWEPREKIVVIGSSSRLTEEVNLDLCQQRGIPVLRRASGGATIVTGPGCLMYAVVLSYERHPDLRPINAAHQFVLDTIARSLNETLRNVNGGKPAANSQPLISRAGISDLVLGNKKFSGNSLRCKRNHFLYHGTLLYRFPLEEISALLKTPPRQPDYRRQRSHRDFIANLSLERAQLSEALIQAFSAEQPMTTWPSELTKQLVVEKYSRDEWNQRM